MRIESDAVIPYPRDLVFTAYRDELPKMVPYLPNIRGIEVKSRSEHGNVVDLLNLWRGGGDIPAAVRTVLSDDMLAWNDHASWNEADHTCSWRVEHLTFTDAVQCGGVNRIVELGPDRTRIEIRGDIAIDLKKMKIVPGFLANTVGRKVEEFMVRQITTNLTAVSEGVAKYLGSKAKPS